MLRIIGDIGFEFWADIPGYERSYQASTYGNIRSLDRVVDVLRKGKTYKLPLKGIVLKGHTDKFGYLRYDVKKKGKEFGHQLVSRTFIPNPYNYQEINHKDEHKDNNRVENLEWCTRSYNCSYGSWAEQHNAVCCKSVVSMIDGVVVKKYKSIADAARDVNGRPSEISRVLKGTRKHYKKLEWAYA